MKNQGKITSYIENEHFGKQICEVDLKDSNASVFTLYCNSDFQADNYAYLKYASVEIPNSAYFFNIYNLRMVKQESKAPVFSDSSHPIKPIYKSSFIIKSNLNDLPRNFNEIKVSSITLKVKELTDWLGLMMTGDDAIKFIKEGVPFASSPEKFTINDNATLSFKKGGGVSYGYEEISCNISTSFSLDFLNPIEIQLAFEECNRFLFFLSIAYNKNIKVIESRFDTFTSNKICQNGTEFVYEENKLYKYWIGDNLEYIENSFMLFKKDDFDNFEEIYKNYLELYANCEEVIEEFLTLLYYKGYGSRQYADIITVCRFLEHYWVHKTNKYKISTVEALEKTFNLLEENAKEIFLNNEEFNKNKEIWTKEYIKDILKLDRNIDFLNTELGYIAFAISATRNKVAHGKLKTKSHDKHTIDFICIQEYIQKLSDLSLMLILKDIGVSPSIYKKVPRYKFSRCDYK